MSCSSTDSRDLEPGSARGGKHETSRELALTRSSPHQKSDFESGKWSEFVVTETHESTVKTEHGNHFESWITMSWFKPASN